MAIDPHPRHAQNPSMSMPASRRPAEIAAHERLYRRLRQQILTGALPPGQALTLRGIAAEAGLSMTPARDAVRRLVAEGALALSSSGRISTPLLSEDRLEELATLRALIEPELAARALPRAHFALIDRMSVINTTIAEAVASRDPVAYIRANLEFHRSLYLRAQAPTMLAMLETVWLQLGPTMAALYAAQAPLHEAPRHHRTILAALRAGDEPSLRLSVRADVTRGLRHMAGAQGSVLR